MPEEESREVQIPVAPVAMRSLEEVSVEKMTEVHSNPSMNFAPWLAASGNQLSVGPFLPQLPQPRVQ